VPQEPVTSWYGYNYDHAVTHNSTDDDPSVSDTGYPVGTPDLFDAVLGRTPSTDEGRSPEQHAANLSDKTSECDVIEHEIRGHVVDPTYGSFWEERDWALRADRVKAAVLMQHGWRDFNTKPDQFTRYWLNLKNAKDARAVVGQWDHTDIFSSGRKLPFDVRLYLDAFFATHLKGERAGLEAYPKVLSQSFDGVWHESLPLTGKQTRFSWSQTARILNTGTETSKVQKAAPGSLPHTAAFRSKPLARAMRLTGGGTVTADVTVSSVRGQLDATVYDVGPDGARVLTLGLLDLRYNSSLRGPRSLTPGQPVRAVVTLRPQDAVVAKGHSLVLVLAGSEAVWGLPDPVVGQVYDVANVRMSLPLS
jgi:X-Pro dipeptidyl-peptidase